MAAGKTRLAISFVLTDRSSVSGAYGRGSDEQFRERESSSPVNSVMRSPSGRLVNASGIYSNFKQSYTGNSGKILSSGLSSFPDGVYN